MSNCKIFCHRRISTSDLRLGECRDVVGRYSFRMLSVKSNERDEISTIKGNRLTNIDNDRPIIENASSGWDARNVRFNWSIGWQFWSVVYRDRLRVREYGQIVYKSIWWPNLLNVILLLQWAYKIPVDGATLNIICVHTAMSIRHNANIDVASYMLTYNNSREKQLWLHNRITNVGCSELFLFLRMPCVCVLVI